MFQKIKKILLAGFSILVIGFAILSVWPILSLPLFYFLPLWIAVIINFFIPIALFPMVYNVIRKTSLVKKLSWWNEKFIHNLLYFLAFLMIINALYVAPKYIEYHRLNSGEFEENLFVKDFSKNPKLTHFTLSNTKVLREYLGLYHYRRTHNVYTETFYFAAPLVDSDWQQGDKITAWVICKDKGCDSEWKDPKSQGYFHDFMYSSYIKAVRNAEKKWQLKTLEKPFLVELVNDSRSYVQGVKDDSLKGYKGLLWIWGLGGVGYIIFLIVESIRKK